MKMPTITKSNVQKIKKHTTVVSLSSQNKAENLVVYDGCSSIACSSKW